ncbi:helix-turn-helix domain-containing protein [Sporosarcina ureae]|uniref:helix-turn-helix domain-containing protein n=1 Tax=Sporosarcina ureae TaxID=1571 RepID=UPI000A17EB02|nr:helix-turn-helix transcriptional regulator [Sporosarcina ureae]ARK21371.1 hypothetical protein SporoP32a_07385 [Sporosarcina ureae]
MNVYSLGEYIKKKREQRELTLQGLSKKIGYSGAYISMVENDKKKKPSFEFLSALAKGLDVPYKELLRLSGYFGEDKEISTDDWENLNAALTLEKDDEVSINKLNTEIALGKVFTLDPDQRLSNEDSKTVASIMTKTAFLLYHGPSHWGTEPLLNEINSLIENVNKKGD